MSLEVCVFGDSIAKGVIFDSIKGRYIFLKNNITDILNNRLGLKIDNYAKFGCTIQAGKKIIEKHLPKLARYKYTALEFGGNDCDFDWAAISERPDDEHLPKTPIDSFEEIYSEVIDTVAKSGSTPVLVSLPPLNAPRYFSWITRGLNAENILKWLGDIEHIYRWHEMYNLAVLKLAAIKKVPLIDVRKAFLKVRDYTRLYCEDGIHPNEEGHRLISNIIIEYISKLSPSA